MRNKGEREKEERREKREKAERASSVYQPNSNSTPSNRSWSISAARAPSPLKPRIDIIAVDAIEPAWPERLKVTKELFYIYVSNLFVASIDSPASNAVLQSKGSWMASDFYAQTSRGWSSPCKRVTSQEDKNNLEWLRRNKWVSVQTYLIRLLTHVGFWHRQERREMSA